MNRRKMLAALVLAMLLFFALALPASADYDYAANAKVFESDYSGKTVILHTNDIHGRFDGYPAVAASKKAFEKAGAEVILVDAGDFSQGTPYVLTSEGASAVTMMNEVGYDIVTLGNHEFDFGYPQLKKNLENAKFKVICANLYLDESCEAIFDPCTVYETKSGMKLGFFGIVTPETVTKTNPNMTKDVSFAAFDKLYTSAQLAVDKLKEDKADLIIGLTHLGVEPDSAALGYRSIDLYNKVSDIDFLIDGHSHTVMTSGENGEPIQSTGCFSANIGVVVIDDASRKIEDHYLIGIPGYPVDETVAAAEKKITDPVDAEYNAVFAKTEVALNGEKQANRTGETNLGRLITDAMVWTVKSNGGLDAKPEYKDAPVVGITNGGGIRSSIPVGDITKNDINTVLPFGNTVAVVYVTGDELLEALEASTYCTPEQIGGYPQTSGMEWSIDTTKEYDPGELYTLNGKESSYHAPASIRRVSIRSVDGKPFDKSATYAVVTNDFCTSGGDTYNVFRRAYSEGGGFDTGICMDEAVMNYVTQVLGGVIGDQYAQGAENDKQAPQPEGADAAAPSSDAAAKAEDAESGDAPETDKPYTLEQVVVLSRHNLRAPLSSNGSVPQELTPHEWINWSAGSSELTLKGGVEETSMGQYFKKWLAQEGLIAENEVPEEGEVRFNARDKQRCRATARYFAAGMLPLADVDVEYPGGPYDTEDFMSPTLRYYSDAFADAATEQVAALGGEEGFAGLAAKTKNAVQLIMNTVDMQKSEAYKSGKYGDLLTDSSGYKMEAGKEPDVTGAIKTACQVADALVLQYYEEPDARKAAFGHKLKDSDWAEIGGFLSTFLEMKHGAPLVALSVTHPLIRELENELKNESRKFSFFCAHDCTVYGTLSALGVEEYALPESIETKAPIGVKLLFERWRDSEGKAWYRVDLVYRSTEQIRSGEMLTLDNPPLRYDLRFEGVETNADGMISEEDLFGLFDRTLSAFDELDAQYGQEETIAGWEPSSPAMQSIVKFVEDSVDESSDAFIPKADRIAVFDMDGTLLGERFPTYFNDWLFIWRALHDESFKAPAYLKAFAKSWEEKVLNGIPIENFDALERELGPKLYEGLTPDDYMEVVRSFKALPVRGFENMSYGEAYFQPMVSLVKYLYDRDYTIYIVSATYRDAVRVMTEGVLDEWIPFDHVIGTDLLYAASGDAEENSTFYEFRPDDELVITGRLFLKNQKTNKVTAIQREIGKMPVLAFGNSTGDFSMATYTLQNTKYGGRAYMLLCDDTERDYGDPAVAAAFQKKCDANGFYTVSMKDEFKSFYPDGVRIDEALPEAA